MVVMDPDATDAPAALDPDGFEVIENTDHHRFELLRDGELVGFADYRTQGDVVLVPHVETLAQHRGNGFGARLVDGLLAIIASDGRRITPLCSFARTHIRDNPHHHHLVA